MTDQLSLLQHWLDHLRDGNPLARDEVLRHSQDRLRILTRQMFAEFPRVHVWAATSDVFNAALMRLALALDDPEVRLRLKSPIDLFRLGAAQIRRELIDMARRLNGPRHIARLMLPPGSHRLPDSAGPPDHHPSRIAAWIEFHRRIDEELNPAERELIDLLYYQGLSKPDAAAVLGIGLTTLKRRWQILRLKLLTALGDDWPMD